jgi:heat shock protein HslJ
MKLIIMPIFALSICAFESNNNLLSFYSNSDFVYDTTLISKKLLKKWQLVELNGQPISALGKPAKTPYIQFDSTRRVAGNNGCNQFFGSYELEKKGRIKFSAMGSTRMACVDNNTIESDLMQVLSNTDSYVIVNDTLVFNRARMAPLARWVKMKSGKKNK